MSSREVYTDSVLRERWDDDARTYTEWDAQGVQSSQRSYTTEENTAADARAAAALLVSNATTLRDRAAAALSSNADFLANASPTNAQAVTQVRALTRQVNAIIRLLVLNAVDDISDTA